jgi:tRNA(Phe) wybutosine-synthesizing methylase Tyw3
MKRINIQSPIRLCTYSNGLVTSWKLTYIGRDSKEGTYHYVLTDKEDKRIKIGVEIYSEIQQLYDPTIPTTIGNEYVKFFCKDINQTLNRGVTKMMRVYEFKEVKRVFNTIHNVGRQLQLIQ